MNGSDELSMHLHGGPMSGQRVPLEPGWPFPGAFTHTSCRDQGHYRRVEDSDDYHWVAAPPQASDGQGVG